MKLLLSEGKLIEFVDYLNEHYPGINEIMKVDGDKIRIGEKIEMSVLVDGTLFEDMPMTPTPVSSPAATPETLKKTTDKAAQDAKKTEQAKSEILFRAGQAVGPSNKIPTNVQSTLKKAGIDPRGIEAKLKRR